MIQINSFSFLFTSDSIDLKDERVLHHVFDCRIIEDPAAYHCFGEFSGLDKIIEDFFRNKTTMVEYLDQLYVGIVVIIKHYLKNKWDYSMVVLNFGCLGGIHRSVFAASYIHKRLQSDFPKQKIILTHTRLQQML